MAVTGWATRCLRPAPATLCAGSRQMGSMCSTPMSCSSAAAARDVQPGTSRPLCRPRYRATSITPTLCASSAGCCSRITVSLNAMGAGRGRASRGASSRASPPTAWTMRCIRGSWQRWRARAAMAFRSTAFSALRWPSMPSCRRCCTSRSYRRASMRAPFSTSLMPLSL